MRSQARFPQLASGDGHYESFYLKACHPDGGRGVWIRHTVHKRPGAEPTASLWFTWFCEQGPRAAKLTVEADELSVPPGSYIEVGGAVLGPDAASGSIAVAEVSAEWELRISDRNPPLHHLPSKRMYAAPLPRTKLLSPHPGAGFDGVIELGEERITLDGWPGMVGHNWGSEHAERWIWMQAGSFGDGAEEGSYLDLGAGRIKLGPLTTPWIANGMLSLGDQRIRLGGPLRVYGTELRERTTSCEFVIPGSRANLRGRVWAPREHFVAWIYADPNGSEHHVVNCSIADLELRLERPGRPHLHLECVAGSAYELGTRDRHLGIEPQPFGDG